MSSNKFKYFEVNQTSVVQANNKQDAWSVARGRRGVSGSVLGQAVEVERLSSTEANEFIETLSE